jgi:exodeoxyribonuclease VII large subunit
LLKWTFSKSKEHIYADGMETSEEKPAPVRVISAAIGEYVGRLGPVWVEGEIAEMTARPGTVMAFMRLKDPSVDMSISVSVPRALLKSASTEPLPPNALIKVFGRISWYAPRGSISLMAKSIALVGQGELLARIEALRNLLAAEGLFADSRKLPLPFLPRKIGLICGRASAAEHDVVENAKRRWPAVAFEIREVAVQGSNAVTEVSSAIKELDAMPDVDVIIVTRGGGSFEDLLPFSDEGLIRLVSKCTTPIVSAIGHEQDAPLLDLVADLRASTPTDAAKRVVPDVQEQMALIQALRERGMRRLTSFLDHESARLVSLLSRPVMADPSTMITTRADVITSLLARARAMSPQATLDRGYAVVQSEQGVVIRSAASVKRGDRLRLRLAEGIATAVAEGEGQ